MMNFTKTFLLYRPALQGNLLVQTEIYWTILAILIKRPLKICRPAFWFFFSGSASVPTRIKIIGFQKQALVPHT